MGRAFIIRKCCQNKAEGLYKYSIGKSSKKPEKVLMVLGATGAGKSTMINGMANYVMGVEFEDSFHFKVVTDEGPGRLCSGK